MPITFVNSIAAVAPGALPKLFSIYGTSGNDVFNLTENEPEPGWYFDVHGGAGNDKLYGSESPDRLYGDDGDDTIWGWGGDDVIDGGAGNDWMTSGLGNDHVSGGEGDDYLDGWSGDDLLKGGNGNDILYGDGGLDALDGGSGTDELHGGSGADVLNGGRGADKLWGDSGADRFLFSADDLVMRGAAGLARTMFDKDVIKDFSVAGGDTIDVSSLLDAATNFAGTTAAQAIAQGYIYFVQSGGDTTVYIDRDGGAHSAANLAAGGEFAVVELRDIEAAGLTTSCFVV